jgi:hypothetical protein
LQPLFLALSQNRTKADGSASGRDRSPSGSKAEMTIADGRKPSWWPQDSQCVFSKYRICPQLWHLNNFMDKPS